MTFFFFLLDYVTSHERKKKYWEQLELRCRHLYRRPPPPHGLSNGSGGHINSAASMLVTPGSQCGYCTTSTGVNANPEDPRYYNIHTAQQPLQPQPQLLNSATTEIYPGGLWASRSTSETDGGCYWNPPGNAGQQRSNANIYSPNPEEMHRNNDNQHENDETNQESR